MLFLHQRLRCPTRLYFSSPNIFHHQFRLASTRALQKGLEALRDYEQLERDRARMLRVVEERVQAAEAFTQDREAGSQQKPNASLAKLIKNIKPLHETLAGWHRLRKSLYDTLPLLDDPNMRDLAKEEYLSLTHDLTHYITHVFPSLLATPHESEHMSALIELKSGVGGSEASLFVADILRMYVRFAHTRDWHPTVLSSNESDGGGVKDAILEVKGTGAYDALRWESGVHRVQRVPATESSGRVHTSTVAAVVLPLSEDLPSEGKDELFDMADVRMEVMRARGAGGQHVNKTESAVRLTHIPTGISVSMQDERSQHQNKRRAFTVLRARLMDQKVIREQAEHLAARKSLVRNSDRSEKIRTYNVPQDRVTDHRLGKWNMSWNDMMEGQGLEAFVQGLKERHDAEALEDRLGELEAELKEMETPT